MDYHDAWARALKETEIIRSRVSLLHSLSDTRVPYIFLSPSLINVGDTVVRSGEVLVHRPSLILPPNIPQFEGFDFQKEAGMNDNAVVNFLLVRGVALPSMHYNNKTHALDLFEGGLDKAISFFANRLEREEDVATGLLTGQEDIWQLSVVIFICSQIARNTEHDIRRLMDEYRRDI